MTLCWVHAGRPFKKLIPVVALRRALLTAFLKPFWEYNNHLLAYRQNPSLEEALRLEIEFDRLFSTHTGYDALEQTIAKTRAKKTSLLLLLEYPELPLHNNAAELEVRQRVRKRDVCFGLRAQDGVRAWHTFVTYYLLLLLICQSFNPVPTIPASISPPP